MDERSGSFTGPASRPKRGSGESGEKKRSKRVDAPLAGADPQRLLDGRDEDLAVADAARPRRGGDGFDDPVRKAVLDDHLELHLGEEIDDIFGAPIEFGMALL